MSDVKVLWNPPEDAWDGQLGTFIRAAETRFGVDLPDYKSALSWSVEQDKEFWSFLAEHFEVAADFGDVIHTDDPMPKTRWFPGSQINYAENILRNAHGAEATKPAIINIDEEGNETAISWRELETKVLAFAAVLKELGVEKGDRIAAVLPNIPETIISMLAGVSLGAVWCVCSPDLSVDATLSRLTQLDPKVLITSLGYQFNGDWFDRSAHAAQVRAGLPTVQHVIGVGKDSEYLSFAELLSKAEETGRKAEVLRVDFNDPLWVLFTSGTTGAPKGIVHGHGGQTLEAIKLFNLHFETTPNDRYYVAANTSWMVWNTLLHAMVSGTAVVTYSGSPFFPNPLRQFQVVEQAGVTIFGTGAAYLKLLQDSGAKPAEKFNLSELKVMMTTGSTLAPATAEWIYTAVSPNVRLSDASGGTDVCSAFIGGNPLEPVKKGFMQGPILGTPVDVFNQAGNSVRGSVGELVLTKQMPAMPVYFWADPEGAKYREAYFEDFPGVWTHGDWMLMENDNSTMILGRSDATLNRSGVRLGSSEIYSALTDTEELRDFLILGVELPNAGYYMPLFVVLEEGVLLDENLVNKINLRIREGASARHVPDEILAVPAIPVTHSGKRLEVPLKKLYSGFSGDSIDRGSIANPDALDWFIEHSGSFRK